MNDIEAAARALLAAIDRTMFGPGQAVAPYVESLRSALAHATRGEAEVDELLREWTANKCGDAACEEHRLAAALLVLKGGDTHRKYAQDVLGLDDHPDHATTPTLTTEGSHPNGPVENCPCHLCRFAFDGTPPPASRDASNPGEKEAR